MFLNLNGQLSIPNGGLHNGNGQNGLHHQGALPDDMACTTPEIITSLITMATTQLPNGVPSPGDCNGGNDNLSSSSDSGSYCSLGGLSGSSPGHHQDLSASSPTYDDHYGYHHAHHQEQHQLPDFPQRMDCSPCSSPPSIQATRSLLIKESLKVTIHSKRFANGQGMAFHESRLGHSRMDLTPEDEERRRRRRERNKVAATKCRNKKKEKTVHLLMESETLEHTNVTLRSEISRLEHEKQRLLEMLNYHIPSCSMPNGPAAQLHHHQYSNNQCAVLGL